LKLISRQIFLGKDKAEAFRAFCILMADVRATSNLKDIVGAFGVWCDHHRTARTACWYKNTLARFLNRYLMLTAVAVMNRRYMNSRMMSGPSELPAYGTAVRLK
jgi:hypothetical protein